MCLLRLPGLRLWAGAGPRQNILLGLAHSGKAAPYHLETGKEKEDVGQEVEEEERKTAAVEEEIKPKQRVPPWLFSSGGSGLCELLLKETFTC